MHFRMDDYENLSPDLCAIPPYRLNGIARVHPKDK